MEFLVLPGHLTPLRRHVAIQQPYLHSHKGRSGCMERIGIAMQDGDSYISVHMVSTLRCRPFDGGASAVVV